MNFKEVYFNEKLNGDGSNIKDNYHSMSELYFHRMCLFAVLCKTFSDKSWKSKLHHDGTMFDGGYFIVGIETPKGQYSYHYSLKYWDLFECKILDKAPIYDGHEPSDIDRLFSLSIK